MTQDWFREERSNRQDVAQVKRERLQADAAAESPGTAANAAAAGTHSGAGTNDPWAATSQQPPPDATAVMPALSDQAPPARGWVAGSTPGAPAAAAAAASGDAAARHRPKSGWQASPAMNQPGVPVAGMRPPPAPVTPPQFRRPGDPPPAPSPAAVAARKAAKKAGSMRPPKLKPIRSTRRLIKWILLLPLLYLIFYMFLGVWVYQKLDKIDVFEDYAGRPGNSVGQTWLLVGSDSREGLSKEQRAELSTGQTKGQRTDTILLLHAPLTGSPTLVSLPRDSWVTIPAHKSGGRQIPDRKRKLNAAYTFGGPSLLVQTVEQATGVHIDHYLEVGFLGIVDMTDAVGGVDVTIPYRMNDPDSGSNFEKGPRTLNSQEALAFVRDRHSNPGRQDLARVENQQSFVKALMNKVASPSTLLQPWRAWNVANAGVNSLRVDKGTNPFTLVQAGRALRSISNGNGTTTTAPIANPNYETPTKETAVLWDESAAKQLFGRMR